MVWCLVFGGVVVVDPVPNMLDFGRSCDEFPRTSSLSSIWAVSAGPCDEFPCASSLILSLLVDAGYSVEVTDSCDEDVGEVGEDELTRDNEWYAVRRIAIDLPAIFDEMWFLTTGPKVVIPLIFAEFSK